MSRTAAPPSSRPVEWPLRFVRSVAAALVCTVTAALGHLAGGGVIPTGVVLAAFAGSAAVAWLLTAHRVASSQVAGLLVLSQVCVHFASTSMSMSPLMITTHVGATIISGVVLARGEDFVWRIAERLGLRAVPALARICDVPAGRPAAPVHRPRSRTNALLAHSRAERGPPIAS